MIDGQRPQRKRTKLGTRKLEQLEMSSAPLSEEPLRAPESAASEESKLLLTHDREANSALQVGFLIAIGFGAFTAALGSVPSLKWLGLVGPLATIVAFYIFGKARGFETRSDTRQQFADSCYFLGFLLTMIAMLAGFLPAGMFDQEISSQGILRHFSMALGATALGLIFRILALQGARSFNQVASEIETTLTLYARRVSSEAEMIGNHLADLRSDLDEQRVKVANSIVEEVRDAVLAAVTPIQQASVAISSSLTDEAERMVSVVAIMQKSLSDSATQIANVVDLRERVDNEADDALLSVEESIGNFKNAVAELSASLAAAATGVTNKMDVIASALDRATTGLPGLEPAIGKLGAQLTATETSLNSVQGKSVELVQRIELAIAEDGRVLSDLSAAQNQIVSEIATAGASATNAIKAAGGEFETSLAAELNTTTDLARTRSNEVQTELSNATDRLINILREFALKIDAASQR